MQFLSYGNSKYIEKTLHLLGLTISLSGVDEI